MIKKICLKLSGQRRREREREGLHAPLLADPSGATQIHLSPTFSIPSLSPAFSFTPSSTPTDEGALDYSLHDDIEGEYTTVRVFLRQELLAQWTKDALVDKKTNQLLPTLSDTIILNTLQQAGRQEKLHLRQEDVRGCFHCELPHQGFRPVLWDLLLRPTATEPNQTRTISDAEHELIGLDAARTRFSDQLIGQGNQANKSLSRVLTTWLSSLPPDAEYRQGADSLAAVVLSVVGRSKSAVSKNTKNTTKNNQETMENTKEQGESKAHKAPTPSLATATAATTTAATAAATDQTVVKDLESTSSRLMGRLVSDFVPGYFFRGDTSYLQEQLARIRLVLWFWDPELAVRLFDQLQISPAMFAVPWFITLFADVWPLDRVAYAWDALFSVGKPLLTFLAVAVLRAKRRALLRVDDPDEDFSTSGDAFSSTMVTFSKLNAGERQEMPNVRWCVLKALSMYSQMPTSVVQSMELGQRQEAERHRTYNQTPRSSVGEDGNGGGKGDGDEDNSDVRGIIVDIERDRRFGGFSRHERNNNAKRDTKGDRERSLEKIVRKLSDATVNSDHQPHNERENRLGVLGDEVGGEDFTHQEYEEAYEDEDYRVVCHPPEVGWLDVGSWLVENSCVTVDLRNCDELQHQWLVQHIATDSDSGSQVNDDGGTASGGGESIGSDSARRRRRRKPKKKKQAKTIEHPSRQRTSFLHVPFDVQNEHEATVLIKRLIVLLRNWGAGSGYVVLVTWQGEQDNAVVSIASALMRAAIPRVCSFKLERRVVQSGGSLLSGGGSNGSSSPRTQRKWDRSIRQSLNNTNGPLVF